MSDFKIDRAITSLLQDEPFFAALSRQVNKVEDSSIPTAAVRLNKSKAQYELLYNPEFMQGKAKGLPLDPKTGTKFVLMHEFYHLALGHVSERYQEGVSHKLQNQAQDLAINSLRGMVEIAPDWVLMPGRADFAGLPKEQSAEYYLNVLKKEQNEDQGEGGQGEGQGTGEDSDGSGDGSGEGQDSSGKGGGQFDDHSSFGEGDGEDEAARSVANERLREAIKKAGEVADGVSSEGGKKGWGSVSNTMAKEIRAKGKANHGIDPKKVLASFIKASTRSSKRSSITKRSRRLPGLKLGKKVTRTANIAISIDQSGSVDDKMLEKFFEIIGAFTKFAPITIVPFDGIVFEEEVYGWKKGQTHSPKRVLGGGTNFDAPTRWVNKGEFDGHIVMTDMMAPKPVRSSCQRMWITNEYGSSAYKDVAGGETILVMK